ncbi:alpha/beta hydrolase [Pseudoalteromonas obscura]|uniref:Alpha/beta hydrolase n=1 Tax=Pseudoalteromonas obscura TaxID=3048491 RepID=A0ABT7ELV3_9GAMM|nr:alpha/beta hydrolase [Pseudoalteromonas sp. P94(2023)]MDK2596009.1 alpha/beta hydrolase [Pseudoalteromonas sp. P94(2023)]
MKRTVLALLITIAASANASEQPLSVLHDKERNRAVPIEIQSPKTNSHCHAKKPCPVAFISAGYGVPHQDYQFLSETLTNLGYFSVAIRHELKTDPPLSVSGNLFQTRQENWLRGAKTIEFVRTKLAPSYPQYDFDNLLLVGHSNGGDLSALLINQGKSYISGLVTLDHRRVPLPRNINVSVLSIRASDFPADEGVLYSSRELKTYPGCVIEVPESRHNDMTDHGPIWLKQKIQRLLGGYLKGQSCSTLKRRLTT